MSRTRYLQLNNVMMMEYKLLGEAATPDIDFSNDESFYYTMLADGHYLVFSPNTCEVSFENGTAVPYDIKTGNPKSLNTLNHLAVPCDKKDNEWYTFIDNSFEYCEEDELNSTKFKQYAKYLTNPIDSTSTNKVELLNIYSKMRYDSIKLYFVNGYDFTDMMGVLCRVYIETTKPGKPFLDLCDFFITKGTASRMVKFVTEPIIIGAQVYDRYIEIKVPCLADIWINSDNSSVGTTDINSILNIKENAPLHIVMSSVEDGDFEIMELHRESTDLTSIVKQSYNHTDKTLNRFVNCEFYRSSTLNGAIPTDTLISDRLGVYIAENDDMNCLEFCMTWKDTAGNSVPLDFDTVSRFNHGIFIYDRSLIKEYSAYEIDEDYEVDDSVSMRNWVIMHTLRLSYCNGNEVLHEENYNMTQTFERADLPVMFYYRPLFTDTGLVERTTSINVEYHTRLMNIRDMVQFLNSGSIAITSNLNRFYINSVRTDYTDFIPFKIYNKIVENKHEVKKTTNIVPKVKYVKVFYDSTDIVLEGNSGTYYSADNIAIHLSQVPKNYKFVIKVRQPDGNYDYMDLTEGYYKLYTKDVGGKEIILDPTYSSNMNMLLGELEFNLPKSVVDSLKNVSPADRKMSIIIQNDDNSISSLFDFMFEF